MKTRPVIQHAFLHGTDQPMTTSLDVAKAFRKRHADVLRAIRNMRCSLCFNERNFAFCYINNELQNGKPQPYYQMTKDGFMFLVMGFTGTDADTIKEAYINAFNSMHDHLSNQRLELDTLIKQLAVVDPSLSDAGRKLVVLGKHVKPALVRRISRLVDHLQLSLILEVTS
jgi:Rha family phage regulatory protein